MLQDYLQRQVCFLLIILGILVQGGLCEDVASELPNWLVGTIAVCVFLILAFAFMLVNHFFCNQLYVEEDDDEERLSFYGNKDIEKDMPQATNVIESSEKHEYENVEAAAIVENPYSVIESKPSSAPQEDNVLTTAL